MFKLIFILNIYGVISFGGHEDALIKKSLTELEDRANYKSLGVTITYKYVEKANRRLTIFLHAQGQPEDVAYIGYIDVTLDAYQEAVNKIEGLKEWNEYYLTQGMRNKYVYQETDKNINAFTNLINVNNISYLDWIGIGNVEYRKKWLSYPLLCKALKILKTVFIKEYVLLDDTADENLGYYPKIGFLTLFKSYKYGSIDTILASERCK